MLRILWGMPARNIYLVRHAQSEWNAVGRWQGQADPPLSAVGFEQAKRLAATFPAQDVTHLFTSDLQRAAHTAAPLATRFALEPVVDERLRELHVGSWQGKTRAEIAAEEPEMLDLFFQGREGWTGGETYADHEARADAVAEHYESLPDGAVVAAVTHGGTLRAIVLALLGIDHHHRWRFTGIGHTSVTHVQRGPFGYRLVSFNSTYDPAMS